MVCLQAKRGQIWGSHGFTSSSHARGHLDDADDVDESGSQHGEIFLPGLDQLKEIHPELAAAIIADEKMRRESSMVRVLEVIRKRSPDIERSQSQSLLFFLRNPELDEELLKCGIEPPANATRAAKLAMLGAFLELEPVDEDDSYDEDLECLEAEDTEDREGGGEAQKYPIGPKFNYSSPVTADDVSSALVSAHARDVCVIDVTAISRITDNFVIATGRSKRHLHALASAILVKLKKNMEEKRIKEITPGLLPGIEGEMGDEWLLVDAGSVVVHLFLEEERKYYNLEGLWGKSENITWIESKSAIETLDTITAAGE